MMRLFQATNDDDSKASEEDIKAISKAAIKSKEVALKDMAAWLSNRLESSGSCAAKVKVLRLVMILMSVPKAAKFHAICKDVMAASITDTVNFSCAPDPLHGEKPAEFVRASATKALRIFKIEPPPVKSRSGGIAARVSGLAEKADGLAGKARDSTERLATRVQEAQAAVTDNLIEAATVAGAKAQEAATAAGSMAQVASTTLQATGRSNSADLPTPLPTPASPKPTAPKPSAPKPSAPKPTAAKPTAAKPSAVAESPEAPVLAVVSSDFSNAVQIDMSADNVMRLPLGAAMEDEIESRKKKVFVYPISPSDETIDFEVRAENLDIQFAVYFTTAGGDVSYPLEGWDGVKLEAKDGQRHGSFAATKSGTLAIEFDNSSSKLRSKNVSFKVQKRQTREEQVTQLHEAARQAEGRSREEAKAAAYAAKEQRKKEAKRKMQELKDKRKNAEQNIRLQAEAAMIFASVSEEQDGAHATAGGIKRAGRRKKNSAMNTGPAPQSTASADAVDLDLSFIADAEAQQTAQIATIAQNRSAK